ncbi:hypothetical protein B0A48_18577 [Cryoendolithus antarcticus]|uniref:Uncharacterized protein n=1 Tax=Cryoendolithus antarcticus TaxID=1507870 RepID=A0A1V8S851_9PEZI|nr:hypothetical protein B0A48_18577 [Cryoendolithus antarcticus]
MEEVKIAEVEELQRDKGAKDMSGSESVQSIAVGVPVEDVRLVYPLPDPTTGNLRDVVIEKSTCVNREWEKMKKEWNQVIKPEFQDHEDDTLRRSIDEVTHTPLLLNWPMPASVIDELRHKYSKFSIGHSYEFTQKIEAQAAKEEKRTESALDYA